MSFTVFLGNLPAWVTADDIKGWLSAENLVADAIKVIRNPETQESKGFAFIDAPNAEEMNAIIRRFDRAPLEDRMLRANPAQPPKPKGQGTGPISRPMGSGQAAVQAQGPAPTGDRPPRRTNKKPSGNGGPRRGGNGGPQSAFAEELAKAL
jgi:RNA recognition motif-containing protein